MKSYSVTIQMKATEQYFPVVVSDYAVQGGSNVKFVYKMLKRDHSNESY